MLCVKIEFCPLYWYSSSPTTIVLYNRMYMCKVFSSNSQKLKKNAIYMKQVLHCLRQRFSVFFSATQIELKQRFTKKTATQINLSKRIMQRSGTFLGKKAVKATYF